MHWYGIRHSHGSFWLPMFMCVRLAGWLIQAHLEISIEEFCLLNKLKYHWLNGTIFLFAVFFLRVVHQLVYFNDEMKISLMHTIDWGIVWSELHQYVTSCDEIHRTSVYYELVSIVKKIERFLKEQPFTVSKSSWTHFNKPEPNNFH